ncbi:MULTISPECIES: hypothetical protein [Polaribacter]|uniref:Uncharacterized protein n=1 Tax=Polaribacter sejongensis TaxID=985043 RepID=A0AAJ1VGR2_9FLAO|nr:MULTISPECIES: hypothetical protein [Polaribacter]AUC21962.1 hypothetical protein BTO15_07545 [Polaribacter sejongensis]MDN3618612.1 hypothetical protein [Polaribacter undariae]UWD30407.1 hypothetical protein NQP51_09665 [Polaribacter undariae]
MSQKQNKTINPFIRKIVFEFIVELTKEESLIDGINKTRKNRVTQNIDLIPILKYFKLSIFLVITVSLKLLIIIKT